MTACFFSKRTGRAGVNWVSWPIEAKNMAGSYDAENKVLTMILYDVDAARALFKPGMEYNETQFFG